MKDSLVELKVVFCDGVGAEGGVVFVGFADYSGFVVETDLKRYSDVKEELLFLVCHRHRSSPLNPFLNPKSCDVHPPAAPDNIWTPFSISILLKNSLKSPHVTQKKAQGMKPQ